MGIFLALCAYGAYAIFTYRIVWRILILLRPSLQSDRGTVYDSQTTLSLAQSVLDILLLSRLFRVNKRLWVGEWIFHLSFSLVILRHLRYVLNPVPGWIIALQTVGICAGYVLPVSLLYILAVKVATEKKKYISSFNFFLLGILLFMSLTGILMKSIVRPDVVGIKNYMIAVFTFAPGVLPEGGLFGAHFIAALILLVYLPAHIFAAPFSVMEARKREDGLRLLMHGE